MKEPKAGSEAEKKLDDLGEHIVERRCFNHQLDNFGHVKHMGLGLIFNMEHWFGGISNFHVFVGCLELKQLETY